MKRIIHRCLILFLIIFLSINSIFPSIILAYDKEYYKQKIREIIDNEVYNYIEYWSTELNMSDNEIVDNLERNDEFLEKTYWRVIDGKKEAVSKTSRYPWQDTEAGKRLISALNQDPESILYSDEIINSYGEIYLSEVRTKARLEEFVKNYHENMVPEFDPEDIKPDPKAYVDTLDEFEDVVRKWIQSELDKCQTEQEKMDFIDDFVNNWTERVNDFVDKGDLDWYECYERVTDVLIEMAETYLISTQQELTIEQAKTYLYYMLGNLKIEQEKNFPDTDEETKNILLQNYFDSLKVEYTRGTGDFYNETISIADKITNINDRQTFLENISNYIDEFMKSSLKTTIKTLDSVFSAFSVIIDGAAGILLYPLKLMFIIIPGAVGQLVETNLAWIGSGGVGPQWVTFDDIFFNKLPVLDVDIFNLSSAAGSAISEGNVLFSIRKNVADWYYAIRNLCIVLSLAVLIYIGIRMAISSIADDKAKYKKMLKDWLVSFALIFVLHYFMVFIVQLNNGIVDVFDKARIADEAKLELDLLIAKVPTPMDLQSRILMEAFSPLLTRGLAAGVIYVMLVAMTFLFMIVYIKRMVTICFLAMIAPLITVTYAIDKAGDGKAQALGKWMSEFVFNILIQPFHCIIYMVFLQNIFYVINNTTGVLQIGKIVVAIVLLGFIYKAEDIVKDIFGFKTKNLSSAAVIGAAAISRAQSFGKKAGAIKDAGAMASNIKNIKSPDGLPSTAQNNPNGTNANQNNTNNQNQGQPGGNGNNNKKPNIVAKAFNGANHSAIAKKIAGNVLSTSVAYGLTGDAGKAYGAHTVIKSGKNRIDNARLKGSINERKDSTRDAYQDYAEKKGLDTKQARLNEAKRLMNADINTLTDPVERNMAEWLKAEQEMYEMMGSKDSAKDVLKNLRDYEDGI